MCVDYVCAIKCVELMYCILDFNVCGLCERNQICLCEIIVVVL
jgi:hypothetical protein